MKKIEKLAIPDKKGNSYYKSNPQLFDRLFEVVSSNLHSYTLKLKSIENLDILVWIQNSLPLLRDKKYHLKTKIYWIFHDIHELQHCSREGCTNEVENVQNINDGYNKCHCSIACAQQDEKMKRERREKAERKYGKGITCCQKTQQFRKKITDILNNFSSEKKQSIALKIQNSWRSKDMEEIKEITQKRKKTTLERYGVKVTSQSTQAKRRQEETNELLYGSKSPLSSGEIRDKVDWELVEKKRTETKRKNNTFTSSKPEEIAYQMLCSKFGSGNVLRQYKSEKYPFFCDFFIRSKQVYVEFQGSWTHGSHPFDEKCEDDIKRLRHLQKKMLEKRRKDPKSSNYYEVAIYVWTVLDPRKRSIAKDNSIQLIEIWNLHQLDQLLSTETLRL